MQRDISQGRMLFFSAIWKDDGNKLKEGNIARWKDNSRWCRGNSDDHLITSKATTTIIFQRLFSACSATRGREALQDGRQGVAVMHEPQRPWQIDQWRDMNNKKHLETIVLICVYPNITKSFLYFLRADIFQLFSGQKIGQIQYKTRAWMRLWIGGCISGPVYLTTKKIEYYPGKRPQTVWGNERIM